MVNISGRTEHQYIKLKNRRKKKKKKKICIEEESNFPAAALQPTTYIFP
jgi:hypothetical protein